MANFNQVLLIGNITRQPEIRFTPKGVAVTQITIAVNRKWKDASTEAEKEEVTFVECTAFGRIAEVIAETHKKGDPIFVAGRLRTESWEDKQSGQKRSKLSVILDGGFQFIKPYEEPVTPYVRTQGPRAPEPQLELPPSVKYDDSDVPFRVPEAIPAYQH
jgi:single-strand DNA-binding protein